MTLEESEQLYNDLVEANAIYVEDGEDPADWIQEAVDIHKILDDEEEVNFDQVGSG